MFLKTEKGVALMDLSMYDLNQLRDLEVQIKEEIQLREEETSRAILEQMKQMVESAGLTLANVLKTEDGRRFVQQVMPPEIMTSRRGRPASTVQKDRLPPIYFHPHDSSIGWSGRGRIPEWIKDWESQEGQNREQLRRT
jgi:DNA-binding protein H-NS